MQENLSAEEDAGTTLEIRLWTEPLVHVSDLLEEVQARVYPAEAHAPYSFNPHPEAETATAEN